MLSSGDLKHGPSGRVSFLLPCDLSRGAHVFTGSEASVHFENPGERVKLCALGLFPGSDTEVPEAQECAF